MEIRHTCLLNAKTIRSNSLIKWELLFQAGAFAGGLLYVDHCVGNVGWNSRKMGSVL